MSTTDFLLSFFPAVPKNNLSKKELQLIELIFFISIYQELCCGYKNRYENKKEDIMISGSIIKGLITDLLLNKEYSVEGLASYTGYPEEVIFDLAAGLNNNPTLALSTKIIELHAIARRDFYAELIERFFQKSSNNHEQ